MAQQLLLAGSVDLPDELHQGVLPQQWLDEGAVTGLIDRIDLGGDLEGKANGGDDGDGDGSKRKRSTGRPW
ncbi:hypothetical protein [Synechococcus sp. CBW1107]|uniref:hypothetical protein n=1 Tax=Synechococcus sp. CBW1107 TaxID=2789857 RepID=UPI002AD3A95A|nr:hypothetical protein [Synechococcus sp. CBW1107]